MTDQPFGADNPALAAERLEQTLFEVKKVIVGQDRTVERLLICLLARGRVREAAGSWREGAAIARSLSDVHGLEGRIAAMREACAKAGVPPFEEGPA